MSFKKMDRKFQAKGNNNMGFAGAINSQIVAERISGALRISLSGHTSPRKQVARRTQRVPRTIKNIMEGQNAPSAATLIELMREFDEVYHVVLDMAQRQPASSEESIQHRIQKAIYVLNGEENDITHN